MNPRSRLAVAALLCSACGGPQIGGGGGYPGDPLLRCNGLVVGTAPMPPIGVALVWQLQPPPDMGDMLLSGEANVSAWLLDDTEYGFLGDVYSPPPAQAFLPLREGEVRLARANFVSVPLGVDAAQYGALPASGNPAYGTDVGLWILYFEAAVPAGSLTEWWLGGTRLSGRRYHLVSVHSACPTPEQVDVCATALVGESRVPTLEEAQRFCGAGYRVTPVDAAVSQIALGTTELGACP